MPVLVRIRPAAAFTLLPLSFALVLAGCDEGVSTPGEIPVAFDRVEGFPSDFSGVLEAERLVIGDADAWSRFWDRHQPGNQRVAPPPVDFREEMVLVVALGTRNHWAYAVQILETEVGAGGILEVRARETSPGDQCGTSDLSRQPVDAVAVPRRQGSVGFQVREEVVSCRD